MSTAIALEARSASPADAAIEDASVPIPSGRHAWLWDLRAVSDWNETFDLVQRLGFVGVHVHGRGPLLRSVLTRDLAQRARARGLFFGASMACDTGTVLRYEDGSVRRFIGTAWQRIADDALACAELLGDEGAFCFNWEVRWERRATHPSRRDDARKIASQLRLARPEFRWWDAPWWWPSMHSTAPTDEFGEAMAFRAPQTYFVGFNRSAGHFLNPVPATFAAEHPTLATPPGYMMATAREQYRGRSVRRPLAWAFQATALAGADRFIGWCFREANVSFWWHLHRLLSREGANARPLFEAAAKIDQAFSHLPSFADRVRAFQQEQSLVVDGWLGRETSDRANARLPSVLITS